MRKNIAERLEQWEDRFVTCRDLGHTWKLMDITDGSTVVREFICRGCSAVRWQAIKRSSGVIISNRYRYPKGYLLERGAGISRRDIRVEALNRLLRTVKGASRAR